MAMSDTEREQLAFHLSQAFKPALPINREDLFAGRKSQTQDVVDAINQQGQHVVLYGERGTGKTSLANMISYRLMNPSSSILTPHVNCTSTHTYSDIWKGVFDDIRFRAERDKEIEIPESVEKIFYEYDTGLRDDVAPEMARRVLTTLADHMIIVVIIDEFDALVDHGARRGMAETIKFFSDRNVPSTLVLVGVADDVQELISDHESIERCVVQVRMPRMSRDELEGVVNQCLNLNSVKMTIEPAALHEISRLAKGLPHYVHLLGRHSGRCAVDRGSREIKQHDVSSSIQFAIDKAILSIRDSYASATISSKKNALYRQVLLACALSDADELGYFAPSSVRQPLERILRREYRVESYARHLHTFCQDDRGPVLKKSDLSNRPRFRFKNPLMEPYVILKGIADKMITEDDLRETRDTTGSQKRLF